MNEYKNDVLNILIKKLPKDIIKYNVLPYIDDEIKIKIRNRYRRKKIIKWNLRKRKYKYKRNNIK